MKIILTLFNLALAAKVSCFPHLAMDSMTDALRDEALSKRQSTPPQGAGALPLVPPPFDAESQKIDVSGDHEFVAPGPGDERGQCPGLNAMANHGYLPRNGIATIPQFIDATTSVFGMGVDLATFLATYGAVVDGTLLSWSIGGIPRTGIAGSHSNYETDSSPLKGDLYQYGDLGKLVISQYKTLRDMQPDAATSNYNLDVLRQFRKMRFQESIDKNPKFAYLPFTGMAVSQAAFTFIYRFMANHSAEAPEGILSRDVLESFMSISGSEANPVWTRGNERIPENWYRRNTADAYTIPYFETDMLYLVEVEPRIVLVGCNQDRVNSFLTIDAETLSDGAYTAGQAAQSPLCFATEFLKAQLPGLTGLDLISGALSPLFDVLDSVTSGQGCASIGSVNTSALFACPGFSLYGGPTAEVAPGAIQS